MENFGGSRMAARLSEARIEGKQGRRPMTKDDNHNLPTGDDPLQTPKILDRRGKANDPSEDEDELQDPEETTTMESPGEVSAEIKPSKDTESAIEAKTTEYPDLGKQSIAEKIRRYLEDPKLKAIRDECWKLDKSRIEARVQYGGLIKEVRDDPSVNLTIFVSHILCSDMMDAHRSLRCYEAAERVGLNSLLCSGLSESAIWRLVAPGVPEEALLEALELSKTEKVTAAKAEQIALKWLKAKDVPLPRRRSTKKRPEKVQLEPTPEAIARYMLKTFTEEENERTVEFRYITMGTSLSTPSTLR
jgi:hypothetical protein